MSLQTPEPDPDAITPRLIKTIQQFCSRYRYQYPTRVQNAIYLLDHNHAETHNEPYTTANYYPAYEGIISPEITHILEHELDTDTSMVHISPNREKRKYSCHYIGPVTDSDTINPEIINTHAEPIEQLTKQELINKTRNTTGYKTTPDYERIPLAQTH